MRRTEALQYSNISSWRLRLANWLIGRLAGKRSIVMNCRVGEDGWALTVTDRALCVDFELHQGPIHSPLRILDERGIICGWLGTSSVDREAAHRPP